jgi:hypothetical protein
MKVSFRLGGFMDLSQVQNNVLISNFENWVRSERKITHTILWYINEIEYRRSFAEMGYESMIKYLTRRMGYSESSAYERVQAARLLRKIPHLGEKLEKGALNLTQMVQVSTCLNKDSKTSGEFNIDKAVQVFEQIETKSGFTTQKILAVEFNQSIQMHEVLKPQRDESVRLELTLTDAQMEKLRRAKDLLSHSLPYGNWADVITFLAEKHIQKIEGKAIPKNTESATQNETLIPIAPSATVAGKRKYISSATRREVMAKAGNRCEYVDDQSKRRCEGKYQVQTDHRIAVAHGGDNHPSNLRALCRTHNLLAAKQMGLGF